MTEINKIPLAGWKVEVNTGTVAVPVWTQVKGQRNQDIQISPTNQDTSTFDSNGWGSDGSTQKKYKVVLEGLEGYTSAYVRDPGQVFLKTKGKLVGDLANVQWRAYRLNPDEGYQGTAEAQWNGTGGSLTEFTRFQCELLGQGELLDYDPTP
jgi:hypothetical protein